MKKKILTVFSVIFILVGILILALPAITQNFNKQLDDSRIDRFIKSVENLELQKNGEDIEATDTDIPKYDPEKLEKLYFDMKEYNEELYENGQDLISDPFAYESSSFDLSEYGIFDSIFGYIYAPSVDLKIPLYLGADKGNMNKGCAHLNYTSVPVGGENTNTVIAGHRGVPEKLYFDNIVNLEIGDSIFVTNFWETLEYRVQEIKIIKPTENQDIYIQKGEDLLTLFTCHPYGKTTYRFIVICERIG